MIRLPAWSWGRKGKIICFAVLILAAIGVNKAQAAFDSGSYSAPPALYNSAMSSEAALGFPSQRSWEMAVFQSDLNAESTEKFISDAALSGWVFRLYGCLTDECKNQVLTSGEGGGQLAG